MVEPILVANLNSEAERRICDSTQKRIQPNQKFLRIFQHPFVKFRELKKHRAELIAQQRNGFDEFIKLRLTADENFFVRYDLWNLHCENKVWRRPVLPVFYRGSFGRSVKRGINLDSSETFRIKTEIIAGVHAARVEAAFPSSGSERRCSQKEAGNLVPLCLRLSGSFGLQLKQSRNSRPRRMCVDAWLIGALTSSTF